MSLERTRSESSIALELIPSPTPLMSNLSEAEKTAAARDPEVTVCNICYSEEALVVVAKECGHQVCKQCIAKDIAGKCFSGGAFQIECPYGCGAVIDGPVLEQCATKKQLCWLTTNAVNHAFLDCGEKQYWCPVCDTGFMSDSLHKCPEFQCPNCQKWACQRCHTEILPDIRHECKESENADVGVVGTHAIECPACGAPTVRVAGCNHMTCPCGVDYCWLCGDVITGRVEQHYIEECTQLGDGGCPNVVDAVGQARLRKNLLWMYVAVLLTGPISLPLMAFGIGLTAVSIRAIAPMCKRLARSSQDVAVDGMKLMVVFLLLPFMLVLGLVMSIVAGVLVLIILIVGTYVAIPLEACRRRRLTTILVDICEGLNYVLL